MRATSGRAPAGKLRKALNRLVLAAAAVGLGWYVWLFASADARMQRICNELRPGMSVEGVRSFARARGLREPRKDDGIEFLVETRTFGRWGCKLVLDKGTLQRVEFNIAD